MNMLGGATSTKGPHCRQAKCTYWKTQVSLLIKAKFTHKDVPTSLKKTLVRIKRTVLTSASSTCCPATAVLFACVSK